MVLMPAKLAGLFEKLSVGADAATLVVISA
jgi:hypothetical protein